MPSDMIFPSKTGALWWSTIAFTILILTFSAYLNRSQTGPLVFVVIIGALVLGFFLWLTVTTRYVVAEGELIVRSGPSKWVIPLDSIESVTETNNPMSSPALSLDRLEIRHANGSILISPNDKAEFLAALGQ